MDVELFAKLCKLVSEGLQDFLPGQLWWVALAGGAVALLGLAMMFFGLKAVRVLCALLAVPTAAMIGAAILPGLGQPAWLGAGLGAVAGILAGALLFRVVVVLLAVKMMLMLLVLGAGVSLGGKVDWDALLNLSPKVGTTTIAPFEDVGKTRREIFEQRVVEQYRAIVKAQPWLPWALGGLALVLVVAGVAGGVWVWRVTALVISLFYGLQLLLVGGGVFLLKASPTTFEHLLGRPLLVLAGLVVLSVVGAGVQWRTARRRLRPVPVALPPEPTERPRTGGWAM